MQRNFKNNKNLKDSLNPDENKMSCGFSSLFSQTVDWYAIVSVKANKTSQGMKGIF